ncbi:MAG: metallophosphoesterase [Clostridia bacterium]|nr:metallophosphoesterase [Clostridia bacterium]
MKKIVVISDTHGDYRAIDKLLPIINESDYLFHLGDFYRDIRAYERELKCKLYSVLGNCDGGGDDELITIDGVKILLTHGDRYGVKSSKYKLLMRAKELGVKVVFYGHTHISDIEEIDGIYLINPGALSSYNNPTYCYAVIYDKKVSASIVSLL